MDTKRTPHADGLVDRDRLLAIYLRDHASGAAAGHALAQRARRANPDNSFTELFTDLENEIAEDRSTLEALMAGLDIRPSQLKNAVGAITEFAARLKSNGRLVRYSPSSRVVELEGLAAGVLTKRNLWRSLRAVANQRPELDTGQLDELIARATAQLDRLLEAHSAAATLAIGRDTSASLDPTSK